MPKNRQKTGRNSEMTHDFFTNVPPEIITDIFLGLSVKSILSCKCVCKSWLNLVESPKFPELHLSKSAPGLVVLQEAGLSKSYKILEMGDEFGPHYFANNCDAALRFTFPLDAHIYGSVNGLLLLYNKWKLKKIFICNPITRDYLKLPLPSPYKPFFHYYTFGFGVSKMTGKYKLVMIYQEYVEFSPPTCEVYTLGTRSWRSIGVCNPLMYERRIAAFLNGNLHWLGFDSEGYERISCFDLETELFSTFWSPPNAPHNPELSCFSVVGDCLCICRYNASAIVVWLMKDYGDEKSWTKEFVIEHPTLNLGGLRFPVKVFEDGEILIAEEGRPGFLYYSNMTKTLQEIFPYDACCQTSGVVYTPSFLSVRMFEREDVKLLDDLL